MEEEKIRIKSKEPNIRIKKSGKVSFEYEFPDTDTVIKVPKEHAEIILKNNTFEKVKGTIKKTKDKRGEN